MKFRDFLFRVSLCLIILVMVGCASKPTIEIHEEFGKYFDHYGITGSFALFDKNNNKYILYNPGQFEQPFIPASTFKILNSLIGLETGVIADENFIIPWDSVIRKNQYWNCDHDLKSAFKNSTVWYYQELARRVRGERMKFWLNRVNFGNADTTGGIDMFWLTGGLRISPKEQLGFLQRLHDSDLPFSPRNIEIVKKMMIAEGKPGWVLRAKTGWGNQSGQDIGWYIGYLETNDNVYFFSNCIQNSDTTNNSFALARKSIVYQILEELRLTSEDNVNDK